MRVQDKKGWRLAKKNEGKEKIRSVTSSPDRSPRAEEPEGREGQGVVQKNKGIEVQGASKG